MSNNKPNIKQPSFRSQRDVGRRRMRFKSRKRRKKNTEAGHQLSGVTYMQPCHWVRDSMKYGQRAGAEGLIEGHHKRRQVEPKEHNGNL